MPDTIYLNRLRISALIGILPSEKIKKQPLWVDLGFHVNAKKIAKDDDIEIAIDYSQVRSEIIDFIQSHQFNLIETLAQKLVDYLFSHFPIKYVELKLTKPEVFEDADGVSIFIKRECC